MVIVQVVPNLPPAIDGIGDYALNLARQLRTEFGKETHFVVGAPTWEGEKEIDGFPINAVSVRSASAMLSALLDDRSSPVTVLLHYVGYGYAKRGCPFWLVDACQRWRTTGANRFLVTMFHEVYAYGRPPWTSSFWLSPLQRNLAGRLAYISDRCLTSRQDYAKLLYKFSDGKQTQIPVLPVFSGIGEPQQVFPLAVREQRLVVFGSPSNRRRVYRESFVELERTCQLLGIKEIWDVGPSMRSSLPTVNGVPIVERRQLRAAEISSILSSSLAGFFNYNPEYLAKSTIFAAYCAHGLLPISPYGTAPVDGIEPGEQYWVPDALQKAIEIVELQAIADNAHAWYQTHNLSVQAKTFATLLANTQ